MLYDVSWDVYAVRGTRGARRLEDLPEPFTPPTIGTQAAVIEKVRDVAPHVEVIDSSWLRLVGSDHSIELSLGKAEQVRDVTFFIHKGDGAVAVVRSVCRSLALTAYDTETGELLRDDATAPQAAGSAEPERPTSRRWWRR
jgi:hypothetical protein